ncbi:hypothetical protein AMEX_G21931, partial [Astyanax mexicanus]
CRSDQSCVFYGAVGRPLYLQLPDEEELKLFTIKSDYYSDRILHFKNKIIIGKPSDPRWEFNTENKTMIITRAEKKDSARYRLHTYNSTGTNTGIYYLQLIIEAVVSSVEVMDSCSSIMERRVNCSSDGDQIQFSWTLSGTTSGPRLTDGNQTLLLDKDYTGDVTCYVKNYVSSGYRTIELQQCPGKINLIFTELICTGLITVDDRCRSDQSCVFYRALGRPLDLQLPKEEDLQLKKINSGTTSDVVFQYRNKKIRINHLDQRWEFNNETKTMIITRAEKEDSGRYKLETFNSTGKQTNYSLHLIIEGNSAHHTATSTQLSKSFTIINS